MAKPYCLVRNFTQTVQHSRMVSASSSKVEPYIYRHVSIYCESSVAVTANSSLIWDSWTLYRQTKKEKKNKPNKNQKTRMRGRNVFKCLSSCVVVVVCPLTNVYLTSVNVIAFLLFVFNFICSSNILDNLDARSWSFLPLFIQKSDMKVSQ